MCSVSGLVVYPVKGARGIEVEKARIRSTGFAWDRNWVVVYKDKFESQRKDPKMALIKTSLPTDALLDDLRAEEAFDLTLSVPGQEDFKVPVGAGRATERRTCSVWEWTGEGIDEGDLAAEYLSDFMGHEVRLVRYAGQPDQGTPESATERRRLDPNFSPPDTETAFSDAMPFLITTEASLADLNSKCPEDIPMNRFRPNIIVRQAEPWEEDNWQSLKINSLDFTASMPNGRCAVTTVNQSTGRRGKSNEPLKTLQTFRKGSTLGFTADPKWNSLVFFGTYFVAPPTGFVSVDDPIDILKRRTGPPQQWGSA